MRTVFLIVLALVSPNLVAALPARAADIESTCYTDCESRTASNPEYKACLAQKADAADAVLNKAYGILKSAIRLHADVMGQAPNLQLQSLTAAQKKWISHRDANCTFEDELAFGATSIGGNYSACLCALSLARAADFARIKRQLLSE